MKHLLNNAMYEIRDLRRRNEILSAKVEVMDLFALVLNTSPARQSIGMSEDVAWALQKKIDELNKEDEANALQGHAGKRTDESKSSSNGSKGF
jgi:hypothetical protein